MEQIEEKVLEILAEICEDEIVLKDREVHLLENGLLDSMGFAELIVELEDAFGIIVSPTELDRTEFETPGKVIELVKAKIVK